MTGRVIDVTVLLFFLFGLVIGWLVNGASDYLPRFASDPPAISTPYSTPALLSILSSKRDGQPWFKAQLAVELLTALFFAWLGARLEFTLETLVLAISFPVYALIAVIDLKYRLVLNVVVYPAIALVIVAQLLLVHQEPRAILLGGILAFSVFYMVAWLKPGQLGGGDIKLAALIGLTFGFPQVLLALLVGAGMGALVALLLLWLRTGLKYRIPYAPFLCFGAIVLLLYHAFQIPL